ncbi:MAG: hypothetical protein K2H89_12950 [Oscillospiraceae bacterium]|nr:hypothetical protein [Oscillospiraceae bacterium]
MTEKMLGKITRAEYGMVKEYPFLIGLQLSFSFGSSSVSDGGKYTLNIDRECKVWEENQQSQAITENIENVYQLLNDAKVNYVSQLVGKPVEVTIEDNSFRGFRILTEVL